MKQPQRCITLHTCMLAILTTLCVVVTPVEACDVVKHKGGHDLGVVMYTTSWCPYCHKTKDFFDSIDVNYTNCDVEKSIPAYNAYKALQGRGYPLIFIKGTRIQGYDKYKLSAVVRELEPSLIP